MKQLNLLKTLFLLCALMVGSSSVWAEEVTYTISSKNTLTTTGTAPAGSSATIAETYNTSQQMTNGNSQTLTLKGYNGYKITKLVLSMHSNKKTGSGKLSYSIDGGENFTYLVGSSENGVQFNDAAWYGGWTQDYVDVTKSDLDITCGEDDVIFKIEATANSLFCQSYTITYESTGSTAETTTVTIDDSGITNKNLYKGTDAGSFSAVVKDASDATIGGAAVTWSSSETSVATIDENTGAVTLVAAGTTTITASYAGVADVYKSSSKTYELNVVNDNPNLVTLWSEDFGTYSLDDVPDGGTYDYTCVDGGSATKVYEQNYAGGTAPELLVGKNTGSFQAVVPLTNVIGDVILKYRTNAKTLTISTSTTGVSISGDATFATLGEHTVTFTGVTPSMTSLTIKFTPDADNVRLDDIELKGSKVAPVTITAAEYATYVNESNALDFSETGITVYTATAGASAVTLNEVTSGQIPANTPVVLYKAGADGTAINVPVIASADAVGSNDLVKSIGSEPTNAYVLANKSYGVGFYKWAGGSLTSGKVYLQGTSSARDFLGFGDATGISEIETMRNGENEKFFNLAGQRVAQPTKGLYIVNGKKVIIK